MKSAKIITCAIAGTLAVSGFAAATTTTENRNMDNIYDVTGKRELFIDGFLLENSRALTFKQHSPIELPSCPNKPIGHYNTIL